MPSGGRRKGVQGRAYPERSDLNAQPIRVPPSTSYGEGTQLRALQQAIPLPQTPPMAPIHPDAPTERPNEHVMTGVPRGAGAGPEAIVPPAVNFQGQATPLQRLQALYQSSPSPDLAWLIERMRGA